MKELIFSLFLNLVNLYLVKTKNNLVKNSLFSFKIKFLSNLLKVENYLMAIKIVFQILIVVMIKYINNYSR